MAEGGEGFEQLGGAVGAAPQKCLGEGLGGQAGGVGGQGVADGLDLIGDRLRPGGLLRLGLGGDGGRLGLGLVGEHRGLAGGVALGGLELGAEPADEAPRLLGGPLAVEVHEPAEDLLVVEVTRPAVGVEDRRVEVVVDLLQDRDEPLLVDDLLLVRQRIAGAELLQDVVHAV